MPYLTVSHIGNRQFQIKVEGHVLVVDHSETGRNSGPTAVELFVAGLASCAAAHAESFLSEHGYLTDGLNIACHYHLGTGQPQGVNDIDVTVSLPFELPAEQRHELAKAMEECTLLWSLRRPPEVGVMIAAGEASATRAGA